MAFWQDWESWEKIVFALGCILAGVIVIGGFVAWANRWKIRVYNDAFAEATKQRGIICHEQLESNNKMLFGAQALESGVLIDGVYTPKLYATPHRQITQESASASPVSSLQPLPITPTVSRASLPQHSPLSPL